MSIARSIVISLCVYDVSVLTLVGCMHTRVFDKIFTVGCKKKLTFRDCSYDL